MFQSQIKLGTPKPLSLIASLCVHGLVIGGLLSLPSYPPAPPPRPVQTAEIHPTEIRIGDKLYFISQLPPPREVKLSPASPQKQLAAPPKASRASKATEAEAAPAPPKPAPRIFAPPQVKPNVISDATLLQPLYPPDMVAQVTPLPSFRVETTQIRTPKRFVDPGRPNPSPPQQAAVVPLPDFELLHADPAPSITKAQIVLPPSQPPLDVRLPTAVATPSGTAGDPVNILSISDRPVAPSERVVVPPGNIVGRTGADNGTGVVASVNGTSTATERTPGASGPGSPRSPDGAMPGVNGGKTPSAGNAAGSPAGNAPGTAAGSSAGNAAGNASGNGSSRAASPGSTGGFDVVVVQSSNLDQFPGGKDLLSGRPIYSVYVSVGSNKEWTLFFCVPGMKPALSRVTSVADTSAAPPIGAPYPLKVVRPSVSVPSYFKYVLVHGYVTEAGRFDKLRIVQSVTAAADQAILASLAGWEFRSATRDGVQIPVEFVLSIPVSGL